MSGRTALVVALLATIAVLCVSSAAAGVLAWTYYLQRSELRLTPIYTATYAGENATLAAPSRQRVVFFGDSRVYRWGPRPELSGLETVWRGIGGETTAQMVHRFAPDVLALRPAAVVIQAGINDLVAGVAVGRGALARDAAVANLAAMAAQAREGGATTYLLTIVPPARPPLWRRPVWSDSIYTLVSDANEALRGLASEQIVVVDVGRVLAGSEAALPDPYALDTLHFTPAAYQAMNTELTRALRDRHALQ
jgi:lysophospholipase L1-like esterase